DGAVAGDPGPTDQAERGVDLLLEGSGALALGRGDDDAGDLGDVPRERAVADGVLGDEPEEVGAVEEAVERAADFVGEQGDGPLEALARQARVRGEEAFERGRIA